MKKRILRYFKHITITLLVLLIAAISILLSENGAIHYSDNPMKMNWHNDGPYVFYLGDSLLEINFIKGNQKDGFYLDKTAYPANTSIPVKSYFPLDSSTFNFVIENNFELPRTNYNDSEKILAISDIESGYQTFRDFLINNKVINEKLEWVFGRAHLVLVGDFVDRGFSTTQVLWFIYKLEKAAKKQGGTVHFILGNHELKNLQGNFDSTAPKYNYVASILGKQQHDLYNSSSFLGKWLASKNTIENINGHLFVHGGLHPDLANLDLNLDEINHIIRSNYRNGSFPKRNKKPEQLLTSSHTGLCWYRGYFKEDLQTTDIKRNLDKFNAKDIIVGHTIQNKVAKQYNGLVLGIDVQHPKDYHKNWPQRESEGLLILNNQYYRVLSDGKKGIII